MPNSTLLRLTLMTLVVSLAFQSGCEQAEVAKRKELAAKTKHISDDFDSRRTESTDTQQHSDSSSDSASPTTTNRENSPPSKETASTKTIQEDSDVAEKVDPAQLEADQRELEEERAKKLAEPTIEIEDRWTRLSKDREIWIDKAAKQVMFAGRICLTAGQLEMFICPEGTKEHESVISSSALASEIHMALLLIDCKPGKASAWDPKYRPAYGPTIEATIKWRDEKSDTTKSTDAKQWIRDIDTKKAMAQRWIFGGSEFWKDPDTGEEVYYGDSGELICLSNFSTATIDVDVKSSQANDGLLFEAFTENIPPIGTKVYTILTPGEIVKPEKKAEAPKKEKDQVEKDANDDKAKIGDWTKELLPHIEGKTNSDTTAVSKKSETNK